MLKKETPHFMGSIVNKDGQPTSIWRAEDGGRTPKVIMK